MKPEQDAFGQKLMAAYKGEEVYEIVERDDGYIRAMPMQRYLVGFEDWKPMEQEAMRYVKGRVLDIGCGAGRHSLYLQKKGFDVLGIDNSPLAIKVCKLRGLEKAKVMAIEDLNFRPDSFDTIIMMGYNFGLFGSLEKAQRLLGRFQRITSKDAIIIATTRDPYETDKPTHLAYHEQNRRKNRMSGQVRIRWRYENFLGEWFDWLMVSQEEMKRILKDTGWKMKKFVDSGDSGYAAIIALP